MTEPANPAAEVVVRTLRPLAGVLARRLLDLEVTGPPVPTVPGAVLAANHLSHLDPPIVQYVAGRSVRFLAVDELFGGSRILATTLRFFGAVPLDRDGVPVQALRTAVDHLRRGGLVGVFPEGRRVRHWGEETPRRGAAWLAWMSGAPLVPVAIHGSGALLAPDHPGVARAPIRVWVEPPLMWHTFADRVDPLGAMMEAWRARIDARLGPWERREESS